MPEQFTKTTPNSLRLSVTKGFALATLLALASNPALATKEDFSKPILIDSLNQRIDLKNNISIFEKNVSIIQGSLSIKAELLRAHRRNQKGSELFIATGNPATYQQTLDDGKVISAQAEKVRYEVATRSLILSGNAQLKQNDSVVRGKTIRYDLVKQELVAEGTDGKPTTTIFNPEKKTDTPKEQQTP